MVRLLSHLLFYSQSQFWYTQSRGTTDVFNNMISENILCIDQRESEINAPEVNLSEINHSELCINNTATLDCDLNLSEELNNLNTFSDTLRGCPGVESPTNRIFCFNR